MIASIFFRYLFLDIISFQLKDVTCFAKESSWINRLK